MMNFSKMTIGGTVVAASVLLSAAAQATLLTYQVTFQELNNTALVNAGGVPGFGAGGVTLTLNDVTNVLRVDVNASGLTGGAPHPIHIHGLVVDGAGNLTTNALGGTNVDSVSPTIAADLNGDNDGFIETVEGVPAYGDVLLSLTSPPGTANFVADVGGQLVFTETYDLNDPGIFTPSPATGITYAMADLLPLELREVVVHGAFVPDNAGSGQFELQGGPARYESFLPVASGTIEFVSATEVPEPAVFALFGIGLAGLAVARRRRG